MNEFADRIRGLREKRGLTKAEVAKNIGLTNAAYWFYEDGRYRPSKKDVYERLADVLGCDVSYLTYDDKRFSDMEEQSIEEVTTGEPVDNPGLSFGQRLKGLREEKQMSRQDVTRVAGINEDTLRRYESDTNYPLRGEIVGRLAKALECSVSYLMDAITPPDNKDPRKELGRRLKIARIEAGFGANEFARKIGIPESTYTKYEGGYSSPMDVGVYDVFAEALGVDAVIFKELDPRCDVYKQPDEGVNVKRSEWEPVTGVYADDEPKIPDSIDDLEPLDSETGASSDDAAVSEIGSDVAINAQQDDIEVAADLSEMRPADLMYEIMQLTARLSALFAGNKLTREEKDIIKASLDMAYQEGVESLKPT